MPITTGYKQLQPTFILGTGQWVSMVAEQMVGADLDKVNQLRDHFPFFPLGQSDTVVIPRVKSLGTASFTPRDSSETDSSNTILQETPETVEMASIEGSFNLTNYPVALQSSSIDQLELQIEFKKIAIRITFWNQFFRTRQPNGFKGLPDLVAPSQSLATDGPLTLENLDRLCALVTEADSEMDRKVMVMNNATFVEFVRLVRQTGASMTYTNFNGRRYATHNGVPVIVCDFVPLVPDGDHHQRTMVWCMTMGFDDNGVFGIVPEDVGDSGLIVEEVQGGLNTSSVVYRLRWYCCILLGHTRGLARLTDVMVPSKDI